MTLIPTADPTVFIEEQGDGWVRYRNIEGRRWIVFGVCDRRGDCLIGSIIEGELIRDHAHLEELKKQLGRNRIDSELDVPVTPEFNICCGTDIFRYVELEREP